MLKQESMGPIKFRIVANQATSFSAKLPVHCIPVPVYSPTQYTDTAAIASYDDIFKATKR